MFSVQWGLCTLPNILRNTLVKYDLLFQTTKVTCVLSSWKYLCLFFYSLLQTRNNITTKFRKDSKKTPWLLMDTGLEVFLKASHCKSTLPEAYLLSMASTCIEKQNFCQRLQQHEKVYIAAHTAPDQYASTFLLLCCRPNSFKVWQSAFHLTH